MTPPLQIDEDVFREWLLLYFDRMMDMEIEVFVHRMTVELLKSLNPDLAGKIDAATAKIREHEEIKGIRQRYDEYREAVLQSIAKGSLDQGLSRYLQGWKAKGPIN
jgi:hypothetical protein